MPRNQETRPIRLEIAKPQDAGLLTVLQGRAFLTEEQYVPPDDLERLHALPDPPVGPPGVLDVESTLQMIASPKAIYYKILLEGRIVGGVIIAADAEKFHMENFWRIFIEPVYQDRGIGQEALRQIYRLHPDVKRWRLGTPEFHTKNRYFYERMGFTLLEVWKPEHTWFRSAEYENVLPQEDRLKL
jgi:GNAT superfamily N-acetyltransferase